MNPKQAHSASDQNSKSTPSMPRKPVNARLHPLALPSVETSHRIPNSSPPVHQPPHVVSAVESTNALSQRPPSRQMLTSSIRSPPLAHLRSLRLAGSTLGVKPLERPSLLEGVARTTLPLSSIIKEQLDAENAHNAFSILPSLSQPGRSSLDSLRSLHLQARTTPLLDNSAHSAPSSPSPQVSGFEYFNPSNWWFNHKSEVDQLLHSDDQAPTVEEEEQKIRKRYKAPKNPVVFCHGLLGFDSISLGPSIAPFQISHWKGIKEVMQSNGVEVLITRVPATSSPEERAKVLADTIAATYGGRSVHLIGHSMGGLDCRFVASHLQAPERFRVLSVTTIATPHRGSAFADVFIDTLGERFSTMLGFLDMLPNGGGDGKAFESLRPSNMELFNLRTPDSPHVQYFSWGAQYEPGLLDPFKLSHNIVFQKEGANDGLVSIESSKWGTYLGTLDDVSHLDLVGWINTARYTWKEWTGKAIKFKPATFYLELIDYLANTVEGVQDNTDQDFSKVAEEQGVD